MTLPTKTYLTSELYPPELPDAERQALLELRRELVIGSSKEGSPLIRRFPTDPERNLAGRRVADLMPWVVKPRLSEVETVFLEMKIGFGGAESEEEAEVKASQYARMLIDLPLWATKRACLRFGRGEVTAAELGETQLRKGYVPSTAHVHTVAAAYVRPLYRESAELYAILHGTTPEPEIKRTDADRARVREAYEAFRRRPALPEEVEAEARREEARARIGESLKEHSARAVVATYRAAGIDAPRDAVASLGVLQRLGVRVEDTPEGRSLTLPGRGRVRA